MAWFGGSLLGTLGRRRCCSLRTAVETGERGHSLLCAERQCVPPCSLRGASKLWSVACGGDTGCSWGQALAVYRTGLFQCVSTQALLVLITQEKGQSLVPPPSLQSAGPDANMVPRARKLRSMCTVMSSHDRPGPRLAPAFRECLLAGQVASQGRLCQGDCRLEPSSALLSSDAVQPFLEWGKEGHGKPSQARPGYAGLPHNCPSLQAGPQPPSRGCSPFP